VYTCIQVYTYIHTHLYTYACIHKYKCICVFMCKHIYLYMYTHTYSYTYMYTCIHGYIYIYIYILYIYREIEIYICARIYTQFSSLRPNCSSRRCREKTCLNPNSPKPQTRTPIVHALAGRRGYTSRPTHALYTLHSAP